MQAGVRLFFFFALLIFHQTSALAHSGDATGFASIQVQGQIVRYTLTPAPTLKIDTAKLAAALNNKITVIADGKPCPAARNTGLTQDFHCDHAPQEISIRDDCVDSLGSTHHVIALITWQGGSQSFSFADQTRVAVIAIKPASTASTSAVNSSMSDTRNKTLNRYYGGSGGNSLLWQYVTVQQLSMMLVLEHEHLNNINKMRWYMPTERREHLQKFSRTKHQPSVNHERRFFKAI